MPPWSSILSDNLAAVRARIASACGRANRNPDEIRLVAVTKYAELDWIRELVRLGVHTFGENRPQQLILRRDQLSDGIDWHLIGHLQRNKVRSILPAVSLIHSVDSVRLLRAIGESAKGLGRPARALIEVNVAGESSKDGFDPDALRSCWQEIIETPHVEVAGLMTMAPWSDDPQAARPVFRALRDLRDELRTRTPESVRLNELSMGMSGDFEVAIEEGATYVRLGSLLFEGLAPSHGQETPHVR